jgi:hypothetical protein
MYVRPAPGLAICDPDFRDHLPPEGREVPDNSYWFAHLRDGSVVIATPPAAGE